MSFSSAEWTIPELCVWIVIRSRSAVNGLPSSAREAFKYSDMLHSGAYAARDDVIEAAQQGKIIVCCAGDRTRYQSKPERMKLSGNSGTTPNLRMPVIGRHHAHFGVWRGGWISRIKSTEIYSWAETK